MYDRVRRTFRNLLHSLAVPLSGRPPEDRKLIAAIRSRKLTYLSDARLKSLVECCRTVEEAGVKGIFVEAGCALGGSTILISLTKQSARPLFVYDVFGMIPPPTDDDTPEVHARYEVITGGTSAGINGDQYYGYRTDLYAVVRANLQAFGIDESERHVRLIKGLVQDTMKIDQPVAFAHIDVDWYEPVKTCLERIVPNLSVGGAVILDDYHDWGGCRKATDEYFGTVPGRFVKDGSAGSMKIMRIGL